MSQFALHPHLKPDNQLPLRNQVHLVYDQQHHGVLSVEDFHQNA